MLWLWIVLAVIAVLILALFGVGLFFFKLSIVRSEKEMSDQIPADDPGIWGPYADKMRRGQEFLKENVTEHIKLKSFDGLTLSGLYVPCENARGTCIVFHGYRSLATVDFAPEVIFLHDQGYRLIVPYQRSHGESEGKYITYGVKERFDCQSWAKYTAERFPGEDIFLMGISMGCATVTMASELDMPNVKGIVADCGFTTPKEIMAFVAKRDYNIPSFPLLNVVDVFARAIAGYSVSGADSRKALSRTKFPVLFIHGEADDFVPPYMTDENYKACAGDKYLYTVPGAGHAQSYCKDTAGCEEIISVFLKKYGK